jgi:hypothetical protein
MPGTQLVHQKKIIHAFTGVPSSASLPYVSLKNYQHLTVVIAVQNATTVTGSAVGLSQATAVAGTGAKVLPFSKAWRNIDQGADDALAEFAVSSNTFTADSTNSKRLLYVLEVEAEHLDLDGDFDCARVTLGNATAATVSVTYILSIARYSGRVEAQPSAIVD